VSRAKSNQYTSFLRREKHHEQNEKSSLAQTSHQGQKERREAQGAENQWSDCHISSAAIIAALPLCAWNNEQFTLPDIFGLCA
jgi:hypothetical protein